MQIYPLSSILTDDRYLHYFKKYSDSIYTSENIHFYKDVQEYKKKSDKRIELSKEIMVKYLSPNSGEELNCSQEQILKVKKQIEQNQFPENLFEEIEKDTFMILKSENYSKFIFNSKEFKDMAKKYGKIDWLDGKFYKN
jgi:hypothetical protein